MQKTFRVEYFYNHFERKEIRELMNVAVIPHIPEDYEDKGILNTLNELTIFEEEKLPRFRELVDIVKQVMTTKREEYQKWFDEAPENGTGMVIKPKLVCQSLLENIDRQFKNLDRIEEILLTETEPDEDYYEYMESKDERLKKNRESKAKKKTYSV